jgi:hypothetical protein
VRAAHLQVNELGLRYCLGDCKRDQDHKMADREMVVGQDNVVAVEVEVDSPRGEVAAHRLRRHKATEAVSTGLACWAAGVDSYCATQRRFRLPTYDARDLVVGGRMNFVARAWDRRHSHPP